MKRGGRGVTKKRAAKAHSPKRKPKQRRKPARREIIPQTVMPDVVEIFDGGGLPDDRGDRGDLRKWQDDTFDFGRVARDRDLGDFTRSPLDSEEQPVVTPIMEEASEDDGVESVGPPSPGYHVLEGIRSDTPAPRGPIMGHEEGKKRGKEKGNGGGKKGNGRVKARAGNGHGNGNGNGNGLAHCSREELLKRALRLGVPGRSKMSRAQLVSAIREASP